MKKTDFRFQVSSFRSRAILCLLVPCSLLAQTHTLRVEFDDGSRSTYASILNRQGVVYVSLSDLSTALSFQTVENPAAKKLELKAPASKLTVTADNSFVTIINETGRRSIYQLPSPVINAAGTYFV